MKKILISDFYGTLVSMYSRTVNKIYGTSFGDDIEEELQAFLYAFSKVQDDLEEFLKEGNEFIIVTDAGHEKPEFMCRTFFNGLYERFSEYCNQIKIFFKSDRPEKDLFSSYKCVKDGENIVFNAGNYKAIVIPNKKNVFDYLDIKDKELYSIGDTEADLDMLVKNIELGGISSLIDESLLYSIENLERDAIIKYNIEKAKIRADIDSVYVDERGFINTNWEVHDRVREEKMPEYREEIIQKINEGKTTYQDAYVRSRVYRVVNSHIGQCMFAFKAYFPDVNLEQIDSWMDQDKLQVHNSFNEFNQKVLNKR